MIKIKKIYSLILALVICISLFLLPETAKAATLESAAGIVTVSSGNLNVRSKNSTKSTVIASLNKGSFVTLIWKTGSWWYVEYERGKYGYTHADYIKIFSYNTASVQTNLNVRSGGSTSYYIIETLTKGDNVITLSESNGWSKILYYGTKVGYVNSQYLLKPGQNQYKAISLNVPNFKQTDSRWKNVTIGSSGKTIGQIGCATTAVAMSESYRTGKTIYPDAMSKKLSYTATGDLYWPSAYQVVLNSANYMEGIYKQLQKGKPVLYVGKTFSGSQHSVVITGYTGGDTLTASNFTIRDPGSNVRTTLQQYLNQYPVFYKYLYY